MSQEIIVTDNPARQLQQYLSACDTTSIFILADTNTARLVVPALTEGCDALSQARLITIQAGDDNKNISQLANVWKALSEGGATRSSILVNAGGGMVTDLGGMAAATFKRGIRFVNLPTTLLGAVDAAVGGKTGINFGGLKNEVGVFREADAVILSSRFFSTLPTIELTSGYAEIIKHALIDGPDALLKVMSLDISQSADADTLLHILAESVEVKRRIVAEDPTEKGLRKALNLGHTAGHAFESMAMERHAPVAHGVAVAWGLVVDLVLSHMTYQFPATHLRRVAAYVDTHYPTPPFTCADYGRLIELMGHDKKNATANHINFTLLAAPGQLRLDTVISPDEIGTALDITRDLLHA